MTLNRRDLLAAAAASGLSAAAGASAAQTPSAGPAITTAGDARLAATFNGQVDRYLALYPEQATSLGLDKGARAPLRARFSDASRQAFDADDAWCADTLSKLDAIPDAGLSPAWRTHKAVVAWAANTGRQAHRFTYGSNALGQANPYVVDQQSGSVHNMPEFLDSQQPVKTAADADAYLARVRAFARNVDEETVRMRADAAAGVIPPSFLLTNVIGQTEGFLQPLPEQARLVTSFAAKLQAAGLPPASAKACAGLVNSEVYPAVRRQLEQLKAMAPKAGDRAGVWGLPQGDAYYALALKLGTTTGISPDEVHKLGLAQNAEINARMDALLKAQGLTQGTTGERMAALTQDPRNLYPDSPEGRRQVIERLNALIAAMRPRLKDAFNLQLKAPVVVKAVPTDIQDGAPLGYMNPGAIDGSRPSIYYINLKSMRNWPKFTLPDLTYHETIPGHAWQFAYVTQTGRLPLIRTVINGYNAYVEGWALYSEQLADEIGMYEGDPLGRLGYLQGLKFRAVRLVVDTGLHHMRWTREQAIDWAVQNSGRAREAMTSEIDRYCSMPGQACGYKVGHTEILRLREQAKAQLGPRYDLKRFDDAVVEAGPMPLDVLAATVPASLAA